MESCLYGLPVITRDVGGIGDWITNGQNGYISDSKVPEEFAEKIKEIITDIEMLKKIAKNNHTMAIKNFIPSVVKNRILNIYSEVYNGVEIR
jgi:glycosyltransferase involved in cell wall biosynthesis